MRKLALITMVAASCALISGVGTIGVTTTTNNQANAIAATSSSWSYPAGYGTTRRIIIRGYGAMPEICDQYYGYDASNTRHTYEITLIDLELFGYEIGYIDIPLSDNIVSIEGTYYATGDSLVTITSEMKCITYRIRGTECEEVVEKYWDYPSNGGSMATKNFPDEMFQYATACLLEGCYTCHEGNGTCNGYKAITEIRDNYYSKMDEEYLAAFKAMTINDIGYSSGDPNPSGETTINAWEKVKEMHRLNGSNITTSSYVVNSSVGGNSYIWVIAVCTAAILSSATAIVVGTNAKKRKEEKK